MKPDFRQLAATPKGRLTLALIALGLAWSVLLAIYAKNLRELIPDETSLRRIEQELQNQQKLFDKVLVSYDALRTQEIRYQQLEKSAWREKRDGAVETDLRKLVSDVAAKQEFPLNSLGSVRTSRINAQFFIAELDLATSDVSYEKVVKFVAALETVPCRIYWKRLDLRPEMRSRNAQTASVVSAVAARTNAAAAASLTNTTQVNFNANLRVLCFDESGTPEKGAAK